MDGRARPRSGAYPVTSAELIDRLLDWYDDHRRALPWRAPPGRRPDPYHVLLSEIMLQQTTASTVAGRFEPFVARFPSIEALAAADQSEVLHAWQGLGYYRRARALHACARVVVERCDGRLPPSEGALRQLPGIGVYTARAILAIAFDQAVVPVDANVARVLVRLHGIEAPLPSAQKALHERAAALASHARAGDVAQALMDLGATVCRPGRPLCGGCPWRSGCVACAAGIAERLPSQPRRPARPTRRGLAFLLTRADGAMLFRRRPENGLLGGLHELPSSPWLDGPLRLEEALGHAPATAAWRLRPDPVIHGFTHFVLELTLAQAASDQPPDGIWCRPDRLHELALPTVMKKLLRLAGLRAASANR
jgi:A/G-specific adenine glycosylase